MNRKQEALTLLALDTMTRKQRDWLDILTAHQAGYTEIVMQEGRYDSEPDAFEEAHQPGIITRLMEHDELWGYLNVPNYATSVDACLTLPRAPGQWWDLSGDVEGRETTAMPCRAILKLEGTAQYAKTLALAMLKAWWALQD